MNRRGIQGKTLDWFKSYLTNRTKRCSVSLTSPLLNVVSYRERSLALFYFPFILTICLTVYRSAYLECMLMTPTLLMLVLNCIWFSLVYLTTLNSKWLVSNRLTLNATKTEFMLIGSRQRLSTLSDTLELSIDKLFRLNKFSL